MREYDYLHERKTVNGGYLIVQREAGCQVVAEFPSYVQQSFAQEYLQNFLNGIGHLDVAGNRAIVSNGICKGLAFISPNSSFAAGSITELPWGGFLFPLKGAQRWMTAILPYEEVRVERTRWQFALHAVMILSLLVAAFLLIR